MRTSKELIDRVNSILTTDGPPLAAELSEPHISDVICRLLRGLSDDDATRDHFVTLSVEKVAISWPEFPDGRADVHVGLSNGQEFKITVERTT